MAIIYEVNPPKLPLEGSVEPDVLLEGLARRVARVAELCDGVHVTESVLGTSRLSPIYTAAVLRRAHPKLAITISMRTINRDMAGIEEFVREAVEARVDGILVVKGDPSRTDSSDSGLVPSDVVKNLNASGLAGKTKLFLSLPGRPDFKKISKKMAAKPAGFVTQVISSVQQVERVYHKLAPMGFGIIPVVLLPSEKNRPSAKFLRLDWSGYEKDAAGFVRRIHDTAGSVMVTSPSDFGLATNVLEELQIQEK